MTAPQEETQAVFEQLGHMTRNLNKTLQELGSATALDASVAAIPDARERLSYVLAMTEQAVSRVLNAVDAITPLQDAARSEAEALLAGWQAHGGKRRDSAGYVALVAQTQAYLARSVERADASRARLMDIMMAQDFQDLTGQVIKRVVDLARDMEVQLLELVDRTTPADRKKPAPAPSGDPLLNGPAMASDVAGGKVLSSQEEVDRFLEDLGF